MSDGEKVIEALEALIDSETEALVQQREMLRARLGRIRAAAQSDADIPRPSGLYSFLLNETDLGPEDLIGHAPDEDSEGDEEDRCWPLYACRRCGHHGDWWSMTQPPYRCEKRKEDGVLTARHDQLEMVEVVPADSRLTKESALKLMAEQAYQRKELAAQYKAKGDIEMAVQYERSANAIDSASLAAFARGGGIDGRDAGPHRKSLAV